MTGYSITLTESPDDPDIQTVRQGLRAFNVAFQARGFCEKHGYRIVGQLDDYPPGHSYYFMRKDF